MNRRILKLAVPSILANITVPLVGMVDLAVAGRLGSVAAIGAIAIGSMLFDLLYWNMGFLRIGTGGITAQAYGRRDLQGTVTAFTQGLATALGVALFIWLIQYFFVEAAFFFLDTSPEVASLARNYFYVRIWAAPATLSLYVFKGWFIGMQNTVSPMAVDITVNVVNLVASWVLALYTPLGMVGVALGTVIAQYTGLALASVLFLRYYRKLLRYFSWRRDVRLRDMRRYFVLNGNLFLRSLCMLAVYTGFTALSARFGDTLLAVGSIVMKLLMFYSYFLDGFAYAGEALAGKYIGARDKASLSKAVRLLFVWSLVIGIFSTFVYGWGGRAMLGWVADNEAVVQAAEPFLIWLLLMPLLSSAAFMWDGIFIGATAATAIRNSMVWSVVAFFGVFFAVEGLVGSQALFLAYAAHLLARAIYLTATARREIFIRPFA